MWLNETSYFPSVVPQRLKKLSKKNLWKFDNLGIHQQIWRLGDSSCIVLIFFVVIQAVDLKGDLYDYSKNKSVERTHFSPKLGKLELHQSMGYEKPHICFIGYSQTVIHVPVLCKKQLFPLLRIEIQWAASTKHPEAKRMLFWNSAFRGVVHVAARCSSAAKPESHQIQPFSRRGKLNFCSKMEGPKIIWALEVWWRNGWENHGRLTLVSAGLQFLGCTACLRSDYFIRAVKWP